MWADKPAISTLKEGEQKRDLLLANIPPGELGQKLNLGFKPHYDEHFYAYSQENAEYSLYKNPNLYLKGEEYQVKIELKGENLEAYFKFCIMNRNKQIIIEQTNKPIYIKIREFFNDC